MNKKIESTESENFKVFRAQLLLVLTQIAKGLIRDGGGATKFVTIVVRGARTDEEALRAARKISCSEQVKAPLSGGKGNWGAVVMAAGSAGVEVHPEHISVWLHKGSEEDELSDTTVLLRDGHIQPVDTGKYVLTWARRTLCLHNLTVNFIFREDDILSQNDLTIEIDLGCKPNDSQTGEAHVWTTDLTVEYIQENS
jgi:glutamate N-acetyltransferase / amino-acid N-acetyltransferase